MKRFVFAFAFVLIANSSVAQNPDLPTRNEAGKRTALPTRKHAFSVEFVAPLLRHFTAGHEMELRENISWETKVGVIFPRAVSSTSDFNYQQQGGFIRTGVKFYRNFPQNRWRFWGNNQRERDVFEGRYIKPEIVVGYFSEKDRDSPLRNNHTFASAILLNFGRQYVFAKRLTLGYEWGLGYAFSNEDMNRINAPNAKNYRPYGWYYSHVGAPNSDFPIAFSVGFNVGVVLGRYGL